METITKPQIKKIYAMSNEKKIDKDFLHNLVFDYCGKEHVSDMSKLEAMRFIRRLDNSTKSGKPKQKRYPKGTLASSKQLFLIRHLHEQLIQCGNCAYTLDGICEHIVKKKLSDTMYSWEANKVIQGIKGMIGHFVQP